MRGGRTLSKQKEAMEAALEALIKELRRELIAADRVVAISNAIEALCKIKPLSQI
jgi:hypothetical protein